MNTLLEHLKQDRKIAVLAPLFKMLEALLDLFVPLVIADIINNGVLKQNDGYILMRFFLLVGLAALGLSLSVTAQYFSAKASVGTCTRLRQSLFDHIGTFSYAVLDETGTDTLITRLTSDINQIQTGLNLTLRLALRSPFIVFGAVIMAFTIDVGCALILLVMVPILSVVVFGVMLVSIPLYRKVQSSLDKLLGITRENLSGIRVIRAFRKENDEVRAFDQANEDSMKLNLFVGKISAIMNPMTYAIVNIAAVLLIRKGAICVDSGILMQGSVIALYNYIAQILVELVKLADLIIQINRAMACAERVETVMNEKETLLFSDHDPEVIDTDESVQFDHVSFAYAGSEEALTDISFRVRKGETIGVIGGTGCGKSTLISLIPRFYDVQEGSVKVDGNDVRTYTEEGIRKKIGIVPQKAVLFKGSIRENIRWGNTEASDDEIMSAIKDAQALEFVNSKEGGLDHLIEQAGRNLSGGQKQRLTIARALVRKPEILILDDSSSALDFATDLSLRRAIHEMKGKMTVFIVSQRISSVKDADQILVLDDGLLVGQGTHDELLKDCEVYHGIYESQFPEERKEAMA